MVNVFHPAEVVDIGIQKEVARRTFYDQVASHFDEPEMKDLLFDLDTGQIITREDYERLIAKQKQIAPKEQKDEKDTK